MCAVSAVSDYYTTIFPPRFPQMPVASFDQDTRDLLRRALEILDRIDKRLGDVECHDESKAKFLEQIGVNNAAT